MLCTSAQLSVRIWKVPCPSLPLSSCCLCLGDSTPAFPKSLSSRPSLFSSPWVLSLSQHLCACFILRTQKTCIMSSGYTMHCSSPHKSDGLQGPRGWHAGPTSALIMDQADFLTLQGTVWSRVAGWRPGGPESSRSRQNKRWQRHLGIEGVSDQASVGTEEGGWESVWLWGTGNIWQEVSLSYGKRPVLSCCPFLLSLHPYTQCHGNQAGYPVLSRGAHSIRACF